ncbi:hypothetical protein C0J52_05829 [Blattella germanica]|nr:hypothetical protein C0J52_05829 [Blattella germanica]
MHPQATRIILEPDPVHSQYYSNFRMGIIPLVVPNLIVRSNIIALRFGHMRSNTDFSWQYYPKQLQELTIYGYLNDERLETVVESCQQLKLLNISDSQNITDTSINIILKLKLLQALYVSGTHLTEDGIDRLLLGLSENEANRSSEKSFKCFGGLNDTNIGTLTETLPNVVQISLYSSSDHSLLLNLTKLNNLKSLSIGPIIPGAEVLTCLGKQLTCLHLENFETLDLITIGENCDSLKCFHISGDCAFESEEELSEEEFSSIRLPGFLSIECLCLDIPKDHDGTILLLARCPNVKKLYLSLYEIFFETVIEAVSEHNKLEYLETLYVTPFGDITEKEANVLATTFKNLRVFHGGFPEVTRACGVKFFKF